MCCYVKLVWVVVVVLFAVVLICGFAFCFDIGDVLFVFYMFDVKFLFVCYCCLLFSLCNM